MPCVARLPGRLASASHVARLGWRLAAMGAGLILVAAPGAARGDEIRVGLSGALTGPSQGLGLGMKAGIEAYFRRVNREGGIAGHTLALIARDDAYEPGRASENVRQLIDHDGVFAILGNPGTPTAAVTVPIANAKHVPFFGAFTGAGLLRKTPPDRYVINFRASYAQETAEMVRGLVKEMGVRPEDIAFFTQNDAYGDAGHEGALSALAAMGFTRGDELPHGRYPRNTVDVEGGLARLIDPAVHPRVVIMVGASKPCAKFIKLARKNGMRTLFVNVSFVLGDALNRELGPDGDGVVVTQVVPPLDSDLPALDDYRAEIAAPDASLVSLEGFLAARAFAEGLRWAGPHPTRETFIDALDAGHAIDLGIGIVSALSKLDHQISDRVWPTVLRGGRFRAVRRWSDLRLSPGRGS